MSLIHGGNLRRASVEFGIPVDAWIDLSTGISPWSWPVPAVPELVWQRLPEEDDGLLASAAAYYNCPADTLLAIPGSQFAISRLPSLFPHGTVALPHWGYREHHRAWQQAGHRVVEYLNADHLQELVASGTAVHAVAINPNNPDTSLLAPSLLQNLAAALAQHGGQLVVDEAFMDPHPECSLIPRRSTNTVILRSFGKFFGLAGMRLGFAVAGPELLAGLASGLDPWAVNHPARWLACQALADHNWHAQQRRRLEARSTLWHEQLQRLFPDLNWRRCALFVSAETRLAPALFQHSARRGLLLRLHDDRSTPLIRAGLPAERHWTRALALLDEVGRRL